MTIKRPFFTPFPISMERPHLPLFCSSEENESCLREKLCRYAEGDTGKKARYFNSCREIWVEVGERVEEPEKEPVGKHQTVPIIWRTFVFYGSALAVGIAAGGIILYLLQLLC